MTLLTIKALSLEMAQKISEAACQKAVSLNVKIAIAVMDCHDNLKHYQRMDSNNAISVKMSQLKALTSASIPISTKDLALRNEQTPCGAYLGVPGVVLLEGGLPIITNDGQHIGSIGVSGANPTLSGLALKQG